MATSEEDKVKELVALMERFGNKTKALGDAMDKLKLMNSQSLGPIERANRERVAEAELIKKSQNEIKNLIKEQLEGTKTQREVNEELVKQRKAIRENNDLSAEQKAAMLAAIDTARLRGDAEARAADASEKYSKAVDSASKVFSPAMQAVTGVLRGISNKDLLAGAGEILSAETKALGSTMGGVGKGLLEAAPSFAGLGGYGKALAGFATVAGIGLQAFSGALAGASQIIGPMTNIIREFTASYTKASQAGVVLGGGMSELRDLAGKAGMKIADLTDGVTANEDSFRRAGLSLSQATKMVGNFGKGLVEGNDANKLFALGFTDVQSRVKLSAAAFEQARMAGMSQADAQKNLTELTVQYGKDLKVVQAIVGKDAEEAMRRAQVQQQSAALQGTLNEEQKKAFTGMFSSLSKLSPELRSKAELAFVQIAKTGTTNVEGVVGTELESTVYEMVEQMKKGSKDVGSAADEGSKLLLQARDRAAKDPDRALDRSNSMVQLDSMSKAMAETQNGLLLLKDNVEQGAEAQKNANKVTENTDPTTKAMAEVVQGQQKLAVALEQAATSQAAVTTFAKLLKEAQQPIIDLTEMIKTASRGESIAPSIGSTVLTLFKDLAVTLGTSAVAGAIIGKMTGGGGGLLGSLGNMFSGGGGAGGAGGAGGGPGGGGPSLGGGAGPGGGAGGIIGNVADGMSKFGPMLKSLGEGAGKAISGIMEGIALGLSFFKPQVLIGAGVLSVSIGLVGAAIAGATWLMGKALPTLAEGLASFADIDGDNLISVGKGVAALGAGLAVFGAGSALGGAGNLIGNIADGLGSLFGGKSQMEKIKEFANMGPGLTQAGEGLSKFTLGLKDLTSTDVGAIDKVTAALERLQKANEKGFGSRLMDKIFGDSTPKIPAATAMTAPAAGTTAANNIAITAPSNKMQIPGTDKFQMTPEVKAAYEEILKTYPANMAQNIDVQKDAYEQAMMEVKAKNNKSTSTASPTKNLGQTVDLPNGDALITEGTAATSATSTIGSETAVRRDSATEAKAQQQEMMDRFMALMETMSKDMASLLETSRAISDHTDRTARNVQ